MTDTVELECSTCGADARPDRTDGETVVYLCANDHEMEVPLDELRYESWGGGDPS